MAAGLGNCLVRSLTTTASAGHLEASLWDTGILLFKANAQVLPPAVMVFLVECFHIRSNVFPKHHYREVVLVDVLVSGMQSGFVYNPPPRYIYIKLPDLLVNNLYKGN